MKQGGRRRNRNEGKEETRRERKRKRWRLLANCSTTFAVSLCPSFFISVFPISRILDLTIFRSSVICFSNTVIVNTGNIDNVYCTMKIVDVEISTREKIEIRRFGKAESADFC